MKKLIVITIVFLLIAGFSACISPDHQHASATVYYIGNSNSMKFHRTTCTWAKQIADKNKVYYNTRQDYVEAGYQPCKVCRP